MSAPRLIVKRKGERAAEAFSLKPGENTIGRDESSHIVLKETLGPDERPWVSRQHARIMVAEDGSVTIHDLKSQNGVFVNGERLPEGGFAILDPSDYIGFGGPDHFRAQFTQPAFMREVEAEDRILSKQTVGQQNYDLPSGEIGAAQVEQLQQQLGALKRQALATEQILSSIETAQDRDSMFAALSDTLLKVFPNAERCAVLTRNDSKLWLDTAVSYAEGIDQSRPLEVSRTVIEEVERSGEAILSNHVLKDLGTSESLVRQRVKSLMCCPFRYNGEIVGLIQLDSEKVGSNFIEEDLKLLAQAAHLTELANSSAESRAEAEREKMMLKRVGEEQAMSLPEPLVSLEHVDAAFIHRPLKGAAGDFYDLVKLSDDKSAFVLVDVSGHDSAAAIWGAEMKGHLNAALSKVQGEYTLAHAVAEASDKMIRVHRGGRFATGLIATIDPADHTLEVVRAGHDPILLFDSATGEIVVLDPEAAERGECDRYIGSSADGMNLPMSIMDSEDAEPLYSIERFQLKPGDVLLGFTDGFMETMDGKGEQFGHERIGRFFSNCAQAGMSPSDIVDTLHTKVVEFADVMTDDLSAFALRVK
jgi:serine phosphatase RsbU (regulator of sigma subunit)